MRSWQTWVPSLLQGFGEHWSGRSVPKEGKRGSAGREQFGVRTRGQAQAGSADGSSRWQGHPEQSGQTLLWGREIQAGSDGVASCPPGLRQLRREGPGCPGSGPRPLAGPRGCMRYTPPPSRRAPCPLKPYHRPSPTPSLLQGHRRTITALTLPERGTCPLAGTSLLGRGGGTVYPAQSVDHQAISSCFRDDGGHCPRDPSRGLDAGRAARGPPRLLILGTVPD